MPRWLWQNKIKEAVYRSTLPACAIAIEVAFLAITPLERLRGEYLIPYLTWFLIGSTAFLIAVLQVNRRSCSIPSIWLFAILFRITVLFSGPPSLSDDVFRYLWDGHLINTGNNPYLYPVNAPELDSLGTPLRSLVNHNWMASPYLPVSQLFFGVTEKLFPQSIFAYQVIICLLDLITGILIWQLLKRFQLPRQLAIIYLWNPLVIMEFAHSAHIDALMVFLSVAAFSLLLIPTSPQGRYLGGIFAVPLYAGAVLTKGLPLLFFPVIIILLGWKKTVALALILLSACLPLAQKAGLGLFGPLDGTGLFGAIRIYSVYWNFNSSIYHWIETLFAGYSTPGAIPYEAGVSLPARSITGLMLALVLVFSLVRSWQERKNLTNTPILLSLAIIPISAYLLITPTLHPWYIVLIIPFIPFIYAPESTRSQKLFAVGWIVFSITVNFSYLTYINESDFREYQIARFLEYGPFFLLLIAALFTSFINISGVKKGFCHWVGISHKTG
jgi:alpha-1,6-mannosyltransferase